MRSLDILGLAISALWQQKTRTVLTTLGVVFGSFVLAASLSIGQGVQDIIEREAGRNEFLRHIDVHSSYRDQRAEGEVKIEGEMSDDKRQRLQRAVAVHQAQFRPSEAGSRSILVTQSILEKLRALDHVEEVVPIQWLQPYVAFDGRKTSAGLAAARSDDANSRKLLIAGRSFQAHGEVVVSEFLLYRLGLSEDAAAEKVLGRKLVLEFRARSPETGIGVFLRSGREQTPQETLILDKIRLELPAALEHFQSLTADEKEALRLVLKAQPPAANPDGLQAECTIVGVLRLPSSEDAAAGYDSLRYMRTHADMVASAETFESLFFRIPGRRENSMNQAVIVVDNKENVREVAGQVRAMGLEAYALIEYIERERLLYLLIFGAMTIVAVVALLVAALGIANTMLMSVLERTREIGIMKAVGAGNGQLQIIFLTEGALIGLVGGALGMALVWAVSFPADNWLRFMVTRDLKIELKSSIFAFPLWLPIGVVGFAMIVTVVAALYPARRAARIDPVAALRHE